MTSQNHNVHERGLKNWHVPLLIGAVVLLLPLVHVISWSAAAATFSTMLIASAAIYGATRARRRGAGD